MAIDVSNYFNKNERIKRLMEDIDSDKEARDNLRNQIKKMNAQVVSVTDDKRAVMYANIRNMTQSLNDLELIIERKERELKRINTNDITFKTITTF